MFDWLMEKQKNFIQRFGGLKEKQESIQAKQIMADAVLRTMDAWHETDKLNIRWLPERRTH